MRAPITDEYISQLFKGTNFGADGETEDGRRWLMIGCVLKRAARYSTGSTITRICQEAGLLTPKHRPTRYGLQWVLRRLAVFHRL